MKPNELARLQASLPCCPNCDHFSTSYLHAQKGIKEVCFFKDARQRPPAAVIAFGCPSFEYALPF